MPDIRDFLPSPPWEGPPFPEGMRGRSARGSVWSIFPDGMIFISVFVAEDMNELTRMLQMLNIRYNIEHIHSGYLVVFDFNELVKKLFSKHV